MENGEVFRFLNNIGLTEYEAKTLIALFKLQETEAPEISRSAQVPKTRVYDVLERLIKRKLVIEISGRPKKYRVIEPVNAFTELVETKKKELIELEKTSEKLKKSVSQAKGMEATGEKVMKVKEKRDFSRILAQELATAKQNISGFTKITGENDLELESLKNAAAGKVNVKLVNHGSELKHQGIESRKSSHGLNAYIIDNKKVVLALSDFDKIKPEYHFTIWHDNQPMVNALQKYFDHCWAK